MVIGGFRIDQSLQNLFGFRAGTLAGNASNGFFGEP
jgi:hypothetical protein